MSLRASFLLLVAAVLVAGSFCIRVLDEREQGFRTLLQDPRPTLLGIPLNRPILTEPGWYVRIPFLHQLHVYDRRLLRYEARPRVAWTAEKLPLDVDYYALWRISDPQLFFESLGGMAEALGRIDTITYGELRNRLALHPLQDLLSEKRREILQGVTESSRAKLAPRGIDLVDLRIRRTDYPESNLKDVFARMKTGRQAVARKIRAAGEREARTIRSDADRKSEQIRAEARSLATRIRGEGDATAARIYAEAYGADPEFYGFVRSLAAYQRALDDRTTLILSPAHPFLKHFFGHER
ncbi:MAG: protease modulator HflC [Myxococcota bacterium]